MVDKKVFGARLVESRKCLGYTQQYLADILGVSRSLLAKYKNGVALPQMDHAAKLATTLKIPLDHLMGLDGEE